MCRVKPSITTGTEERINGHVCEDNLRPHNKILIMDMLEDPERQYRSWRWQWSSVGSGVMAVLRVGRKADGRIRRAERNSHSLSCFLLKALLNKLLRMSSSSVFFIHVFLHFPVFDFRPPDDPVKKESNVKTVVPFPVTWVSLYHSIYPVYTACEQTPKCNCSIHALCIWSSFVNNTQVTFKSH